MSQAIDVYWSFRSPYSYLATPGMRALQEDYDVTVNLRVVLPIAVRSSDFFRPANIRWARYIQLDWERRAEFLGMGHAWPKPDPIVQDLTTFEIAKEQPHIFRLSKLGVEAHRKGRGIEFAYEVAHLIFGGTRDWDKGTNLANAVARAGLDLTEMDAVIQQGDHLTEIEQNQDALDESGHWGVPTFVFQDEPFFGQDRLDLLRWTLDRAGVAKS
jgi:2-hydroxychromene-2-carboxylate isomerase